MRASTFGGAVLVATSLLAGCTSADPNGDTGASGGFIDDLRFGTGITGNGFTLSGEASTFDTALVRAVWFRLESSANFDGRFVRLYFNGVSNQDYPDCAAADSHICLSQFATTTPGTYEVTAFLVKTNVDIGVETKVTAATLTLK